MYTTLFSTAILMACASAINMTQDIGVPTEASVKAAELFAMADANQDGSVDKPELCAAL
jgi:hypothetical protein